MVQIKRLNMVIFALIWSLLSSCGASADSENLTTNTPESSLENEKYENTEAKGTKVLIKTSMGDIIVMLYEQTPKHRDNFIKLVNENYYDGTLFHRVIKDFMVQGGDPESKGAAPGVQLGNGGPDYTIEAEIIDGLFHKKGALCAARQGDNVNPEKRSSGSQFYIVTGRKYMKPELDQMVMQQNRVDENRIMQQFVEAPENIAYMQRLQEAQKIGEDPAKRQEAQDLINALANEIKPLALKDYTPFKFSEEQLEIYQTVGGTPFLDKNYTVFGEVVEGLEIADKIGVVATAPGDRPLEDVVVLSMEIVK